MSEKEKILLSKLDEKELQDVVGGCASYYDDDKNNCVDLYFRKIYGKNGNSFPECAATVEDGSWCDDNDACYEASIKYTGMKSCSKAWR